MKIVKTFQKDKNSGGELTPNIKPYLLKPQKLRQKVIDMEVDGP